MQTKWSKQYDQNGHAFAYCLFLLFIQGWTQKCAVKKASVDVNISYY